MLVSSLLSILAVTAGSLATCSPTPSKEPNAPATKYLFTVNIASPKAYVLGETPAGERVFEPITGGNFSGPAAHGMSLLKGKGWIESTGLMFDLQAKSSVGASTTA